NLAARPAAPTSRQPASPRPPGRCNPPPTACGPDVATARRSWIGHARPHVPARSSLLLRGHFASPATATRQVAAGHRTRDTIAHGNRPLALEVRPVPPVVAAERARLELRAVRAVSIRVTGLDRERRGLRKRDRISVHGLDRVPPPDVLAGRELHAARHVGGNIARE